MGTLLDRLTNQHGLIEATSDWEDWGEPASNFDPQHYKHGNLCRWLDCGRRVSNQAHCCHEHAPMMRAIIREFLKSGETKRQWLKDLGLDGQNAPNCPVCGKKTVLWFVINGRSRPAWVCKRSWRDADDELMRCRGIVEINLD